MIVQNNYLFPGIKIKDVCNQTRCGIVYDCKYSLIIWSHNKCTIVNFLYYGTDEVEYEHINRNILDVNVTNMSLII